LAAIKDWFPGITTIVCDLADGQSVTKLIDNCLNDHQDINVIINNAAIQYNYLWTEEMDGERKITNEIQVNFTSPMQIIYGLLNLLVTKENSAIVNISSGLALAPKRTAPIYCATKAAIHSATKALRYQLENTPVKVFEIISPPIETAMTKDQKQTKMKPEEVVAEFLENFRRNRLESNIGKIKLFRLIQRISPKLADTFKKDG
jgi:short-subunit dehydrogenase involved in D-alanine esterification of teichoic acids